MKFLIVAVALFIFTNSLAQSLQSDLQLLQKQQANTESTAVKKTRRSINPLSILYAGTMGFYQTQISPQWGANCAFEITCSRFSKQLVDEYGLAKGFFLTLDRLGRCNKLAFYETVPVRINAKGKIIDSVDFYRLK